VLQLTWLSKTTVFLCFLSPLSCECVCVSVLVVLSRVYVLIISFVLSSRAVVDALWPYCPAAQRESLLFVIAVWILAKWNETKGCRVAGLSAPTPRKIAFFVGLYENLGPVDEQTDVVFDNRRPVLSSGASRPLRGGLGLRLAKVQSATSLLLYHSIV